MALAAVTDLCDFITRKRGDFHPPVYRGLRYNKVGSDGGEVKGPQTDRKCQETKGKANEFWILGRVKRDKGENKD